MDLILFSLFLQNKSIKTNQNMSKSEKQSEKPKEKITLNDYHIKNNKIQLKFVQELLKHPATYEQMRAQTEMVLRMTKVDE